jgi:hypothetical protein
MAITTLEDLIRATTTTDDYTYYLLVLAERGTLKVSQGAEWKRLQSLFLVDQHRRITPHGQRVLEQRRFLRDAQQIPKSPTD